MITKLNEIDMARRQAAIDAGYKIVRARQARTDARQYWIDIKEPGGAMLLETAHGDNEADASAWLLVDIGEQLSLQHESKNYASLYVFKRAFEILDIEIFADDHINAGGAFVHHWTNFQDDEIEILRAALAACEEIEVES